MLKNCNHQEPTDRPPTASARTRRRDRKARATCIVAALMALAVSTNLHADPPPDERAAQRMGNLILASGSEDRTIKLWRVSDGSEIRTLGGHADLGAFRRLFTG